MKKSLVIASAVAGSLLVSSVIVLTRQTTGDAALQVACSEDEHQPTKDVPPADESKKKTQKKS